MPTLAATTGEWWFSVEGEVSAAAELLARPSQAGKLPEAAAVEDSSCEASAI